jgi:crotonobetainyl-CoA:carnitine CoA-transferase CaiB-like acyl-CoA transferase
MQKEAAACLKTQLAPQPLKGLRVIEFTHMVMGPTCGMVLADLGAEVIKIEPIDGDRTRRLLGAGSGFFPMFNRNKKSIGIDLHQPEGAELARKLCAPPTSWRRTSSPARWRSTGSTTPRSAPATRS